DGGDKHRNESLHIVPSCAKCGCINGHLIFGHDGDLAIRLPAILVDMVTNRAHWRRLGWHGWMKAAGAFNAGVAALNIGSGCPLLPRSSHRYSCPPITTTSTACTLPGSRRSGAKW